MAKKTVKKAAKKTATKSKKQAGSPKAAALAGKFVHYAPQPTPLFMAIRSEGMTGNSEVHVVEVVGWDCRVNQRGVFLQEPVFLTSDGLLMSSVDVGLMDYQGDVALYFTSLGRAEEEAKRLNAQGPAAGDVDVPPAPGEAPTT